MEWRKYITCLQPNYGRIANCSRFWYVGPYPEHSELYIGPSYILKGYGYWRRGRIEDRIDWKYINYCGADGMKVLVFGM